MIQITYNTGGWLIKLFSFIGFGFAKVDKKDEKSVTLTFSLGKANTFFTLAWL